MRYAKDQRVSEFSEIEASEITPGMIVRIEWRGPRGGKQLSIGKAVGFYAQYLEIIRTNRVKNDTRSSDLVPIRRISKVEAVIA